jgi:hypothetical protein
MPRAFLLEEGLDWNTLAESFWAWLAQAEGVREGEPPDDLVKRLVAEQKPRIEAFLEEHGSGEDRRFVLYTAVALLGATYATTEKLVAALKERGLLEPEQKPAFDTLP